MSMMRWKGVLPRNPDFWEQWPSLTDKTTRVASQNTTQRVRQFPLKSRMETKTARKIEETPETRGTFLSGHGLAFTTRAMVHLEALLA